MRVHSENWPQRSHSVCLSPSVCGLFLSALHTRGTSTLISLFVCSHSCGSCAGFNQGKDMVYYATAYRFFHPWRAASALNRSERETDRVRGRKSESSTLCSTKSDSLTGFPGCSWNYRPLCPQIHCGHMAEQKCVRYLIIRGITIVKGNHGDWEFASASVTNVRHVRLARLIFRLTLPWLLQPCTAMPLLTHTNVHRAQSKINDLSQSFNTLGCRGYTACPIYCHQ